MGLADKLVRHARLVVALWIIALVVLAPLALKLDEVLSYEETSFLPENTESVIADKILQEKFNYSTTMYTNTTILLITGINTSDHKSLKAYRELKQAIENTYATDVTGYYDVYENISNRAENISNTIVYRIANTTLAIKNAILELNKSYGEMIEQFYIVKQAIDNTRALLVNTSMYYKLLYNNISQLHMLIQQMRTYVVELDKGYMWTKNNLTHLYNTLEQINTSIAMLNNLLYTIHMMYPKTYFDVTRSFYYLVNKTDAYTTGYLDDNDIATIVYYTNKSSLGPVDPMIIYTVFNITYTVYDGHPEYVDDLFLANTTKTLVYNMITTYYPLSDDVKPVVEAFIESYNGVFINSLSAIETEDNRLIINSYESPDEYSGQTQDSVYGLIASVSENIPEYMKPVIGVVIKQEFSSYGVELSNTTVAYIADSIVELGEQYSLDELEDVVIESMLYILNDTGAPIPLQNITVILENLYRNGLTNEFIIEVFRETITSTSIPSEYRAIIELCIDEIIRYDVNATGVIAYNDTLVRIICREIIGSIIPESVTRYIDIDRVFNELYSLEPGNTTGLEAIVEEILVENMYSYLEKYHVSLPVTPFDPKAYLEIIIDYARTVDPSSEESTYNATYNVFKYIASSILGGVEGIETSVFDEVFQKLYSLKECSRSSVREYVVDPLFRDMAIRFAGNVSGIPEEYIGFFRETIDWVIENYPLTDAGVREYVVDKVYSMFTEYSSKNPLFKDLLEKIDLRTIIDRTYSLENTNDPLFNDIASDVKNCILSIFLDYMGVYLETMKSSDNTTLVIMFKPLGSSDEEMYENALEARDKALEIYGRYYSGVKTYVTGGVVVGEEMKEVGRRDIGRVQQYSYLLTLIVLFIIVEAVFATVVPFISIGAAIMLASGIVYLIAANVMDISSWARVLMTTTALGLGIDYTTFYLHRLREMLSKGMEFEKAVAEAIRRARDGILASASTDIIGFAVLMIAWDFPFLRVIGVTVPIAIFSVFLASLTLIPALTAIIGKSKWFWWPRKPFAEEKTVGHGSRVVDAVIKARYIVLALFIVLSIPAIHAFLTFQGSHDMNLYLPEGTQTKEAYELLEEKIGASTTSPVYIVLVLNQNVSDSVLGVIEELADKIASLDYVKAVYCPTRPYGETLENLSIEYVRLYNGTQYIGLDNKTILYRVILTVPGESDEARDTVREVRSILRENKSSIIKEAYVGGIPAAMVDLDEMLNENFWHKIIPVAVVLMFIALTLTLRGLIAAAITMCIIGIGTTWSIWLSTILFQGVFGKPLLWFLPLVLLVVLLGVGVDYNSFYLVRVRDEVEKTSVRRALSIAARSSGKLIIGLALILSAAYISLVFTSMWAMREIGFVLTLGIVLIALSAVYILSPALISLFRHYTWYPFRHKEVEKNGDKKS